MRFLIFLPLIVALMAGSIFADDDRGQADSAISHIDASSYEGMQSDSCYICHDNSNGHPDIKTDQLCFQCHSPIEKKSRKVFRHVMVANDRYPSNGCEVCHLLHRALAKPQLSMDALELCYSCHQETKEYKSHPVSTFIDRYGMGNIVRGTDGRVITCSSHCHDVHGTDYKYLCPLEPGRELCITCHKEFK